MNLQTIAPGLALASAIAAIATLLGPFAPLLGAPVLAIALGALVRSLWIPPPAARDGVRFAGRTVLQAAIIVSGFGISLASIAKTGLGTLPVTLGTIAIALAFAPLFGRMFGVDAALRELVGIGTAICGASAIAAVSSVIESSEAETALAVSVIFLYNVVAVLSFPLLGHALGMSQGQFGVWAGTAINDTSSVVAAGFAFGREAGEHATIVKLTRALLILPIVGVLAVARARAQRAAGKPVPWRRIVPWFIVWFLVAACVRSLGLVPDAARPAISAVATFLICIALAGIGLQTAFGTLVRAGARPLAFGFALWMTVALSSLAIQRLTGL